MSSRGPSRRGRSSEWSGPNATGKTTFVKMLAGEIKPTSGEVSGERDVSYKPQYIKPEFDGTVQGDAHGILGKDFESGFFQAEIAHPLNLKYLYGEERRHALRRGAAEGGHRRLPRPGRRTSTCSTSRRRTSTPTRGWTPPRPSGGSSRRSGKSALVVDHDVYMIDLISDSLMVFSGRAVRRRARRTVRWR